MSTTFFDDFKLDDWLYFLENRHKDAIQLRLVNVELVATKLDLLTPNAIVITVAGTNGKGSTVSTLEAIYCAAGYRVGSYTSPHLLRFNERIRVNQQPIGDDSLCAAFSSIEHAREEIMLTYFETATLAALLHFKQLKVDIIVLEVGMGGRLDATNIIDSDLAIITTVDLDHQDYLGDTIEAIGYEKAGIVRANKPCIYADYKPPASVVEQAKRFNAPMQCLGDSYQVNTTHDELHILPQSGDSLVLPKPQINCKAAAAAVLASDTLRSILPVTQAAWIQAMKTVTLSGRQQIVKSRFFSKNDVITIVDVAHNPQAATLLADFVKQHEPKGMVHAVFSGLKDKDLCGLIRPMKGCVMFWYPAMLSGNRAASEALLLAAFQAETGTIPTCFSNPLVAYRSAMERAKPGDLIVIYGSFLTVSAILGATEMEHQESCDEICNE